MAGKIKFLLWQGGAIENNTSNYGLTFSQPGWLYVRAFVGDTIPNWAIGGTDSIYVPSSLKSRRTGIRQ